MSRTSRTVAALAALAMIASACGSDRKAATPDTTTTAPAPQTTAAAPASTAVASGVDTTPVAATNAPDTTTAAPTEPPTTQPAGPTFGDLPWPCGPAAEPNTDDGSETGVTADQVTIAIGDDAGFAGSPGLSAEMTQAMEAMSAKCNELGGIHGRKIKTNYYDAKIFEAPVAVQAACDGGNFFLVGEGWAFDSNQEEIRLKCKLPAVPGYSVSAAFAHGDLMYQGVPNPSDEAPGMGFIQMAKALPDSVKAVGTFASNFSATLETRDKTVATAPKFGWNFVSTDLVYAPTGEADWTPFVKQMKEKNISMLNWVGSCLPNFQQLAQTMKTNGLTVPIYTDSNHYLDACGKANADGSMDGTYMRMAYIPFEEAAQNKATQDYLDIITASGNKPALLGVQATSSFLLWATAAASCGAKLTRQCALDFMANTHEWTGGGLHAATDPGGNHPPKCGILLELVGSEYKRVAPTEPGTFECDDNSIVKVEGTPSLKDAALDDKRISRQFTPKG